MRVPFAFYQTIRVFLGCPSDLTSERSRFPKVLEAVNNLKAHSLGFHFEPVGWERVIPSVGRPQELINKELLTANLVVIMLWNRMGSPASLESDVTGTMEEFRLARAGADPNTYQSKKQDVWVYFRRPTEEDGPGIAGVRAFRRELESGKDILFRDYDGLEEWEETFRQNLSAYLEGLKRSDIEGALKAQKPQGGILIGRFLGEALYSSGTIKDLSIDLDGDGNDEGVRFYFSKANYTLLVSKFDHAFNLRFSKFIDSPAHCDQRRNERWSA